MTQKKLLLISRNFPPLLGGMEKVNYHIFNSLNSAFKVAVAGPKGSGAFHNATMATEFPAKPLFLYLFISLANSILLARKMKPDIVLCGSGSSILAGYFAAKITGAKLACYLHGLDIVADSIIYQNVFIPLIKKSDLILVNSNHTKELAMSAGIHSSKINILAPGTALPPMDSKDFLETNFRHEYNLGNTPVLLIVGRLTPRKGIQEFIINIMPNLIVEYPQLNLLVVGGDSLESIKKHTGIKDRLHLLIESMGMQQNIRLLGGLNDQSLSAAFFSAKALIFPVLEIRNDVEGFGMVAIEAAAHGLPTLGFAVGGIPDAVSHGQSGYLVPSGDYEQLELQIKNMLSGKISCNGSISSNSCIAYANHFSWDKFGERLKFLLAFNEASS